jgi:hypothetical protein
MIDYIPYRILAKVDGTETQGTVIFMDGFSEKDGRPGVTVYAEMDCGGVFKCDPGNYCFIEDFFTEDPFAYLSNDLH